MTLEGPKNAADTSFSPEMQEHYRAEGSKLRDKIKNNYQADWKRISEERVRDGLAMSVSEWDGHSWHTGMADEEEFEIDSPDAISKFAEILLRAGKDADEYYSSLTESHDTK